MLRCHSDPIVHTPTPEPNPFIVLASPSPPHIPPYCLPLYDFPYEISDSDEDLTDCQLLHPADFSEAKPMVLPTEPQNIITPIQSSRPAPLLAANPHPVPALVNLQGQVEDQLPPVFFQLPLFSKNTALTDEIKEEAAAVTDLFNNLTNSVYEQIYTIRWAQLLFIQRVNCNRLREGVEVLDWANIATEKINARIRNDAWLNNQQLYDHREEAGPSIKIEDGEIKEEERPRSTCKQPWHRNDPDKPYTRKEGKRRRN